MTEGTVPAWLGPVGSVAQIILAIVAVYLAYTANKLNKESLFMQRILVELFEIVTLARKVKGLYVRMFDPFDSVRDKYAARSEWLKAREEVEERLAEIKCMFSELGVAEKAWQRVADTEDSHVNGDALKIPDKGSISEVTHKYAREHDAFVREVGRLVRTLRR